MSNGVLWVASRSTVELAATLKVAADHIANRLYRGKFVNQMKHGLDHEVETDIHSGDQIRKAGSNGDVPSATGTGPTERPADAYLRKIYGEQYHTDGSTQAYEYARSLAELPHQFHEKVAAHMKREPRGGIWLGSGKLHDLGHTEWAASKQRDQTPGAWPAGTTWDDVSGMYSEDFRALLVGHTRYSRENTAAHEFGHALDASLNRLSHGLPFHRFHTKVLEHIKNTIPKLYEYFDQSDRAGKRELFAEGFAWYNKTMRDPSDATPPEFYGSVAAGRHLIDFYRMLDKELGIER